MRPCGVRLRECAVRGAAGLAGRAFAACGAGQFVNSGSIAHEVVQAAQGQKQKVARTAGQGRRRSGAGAATTVDGRAEFRELFVSLIDPAELLDMKKCGRIAARMGEASSRSGYHEGVRMASLLSGIFADAADIVDRPVEDGALHQTTVAYREMRAALYGTAVSYRGGGDGEPVGGLEELGRKIAVLRSEADARRARLRAADPPGSGLRKFDALYKGKVCRDVVREDIEEIRAHHVAAGEDPIFPPEVKYLDEVFEEFRGGLSAADMVAMERGKWPPEGYELVKVDSAK